MPRAHEAHLAHHRVARLVPELAGHVDVVVPGLAACLGDDRGHHLGHVDLPQPLVVHHERLRLGRELRVVEEGLGVDAHVVGVGEALVAPRHPVERAGLRREEPGGRCPRPPGRSRRGSRPGRAAARAGPSSAASSARLRRADQPLDAAGPVLEHLVDLDQGEAADPVRGMVDKAVRPVAVARERVAERRHRVLVDAHKERRRVRRRQDLVKEHVEGRVRGVVEAERRLPHLPHALPPRGGVLRAVVGVEAEAHLELVGRLRREALDQDLVEPPQGPVVALEPLHALVDRESDPGRLGDGADPGDRGQVAVGAVVFEGRHGSFGF